MIYLLIFFVFLAVIGLGILVGVYYFKCDYTPPPFPPDPEIENLPRCTCFDVNDCEIHCRAKALFAKFPPED
ncbi:MAG: hypothetical protein JJE55_06995 [Flavobacteriaceae bacterium]|nr:hypothetical protein [Flavobacteriaceae bacterium]